MNETWWMHDKVTMIDLDLDLLGTPNFGSLLCSLPLIQVPFHSGLIPLITIQLFCSFSIVTLNSKRSCSFSIVAGYEIPCSKLFIFFFSDLT